jgi:hypothetical protein
VLWDLLPRVSAHGDGDDNQTGETEGREVAVLRLLHYQLLTVGAQGVDHSFISDRRENESLLTSQVPKSSEVRTSRFVGDVLAFPSSAPTVEHSP